MVNDKRRQKPGKGIYLLPNLFTTGALFSGFYAIVAAMKFQFELAAMAIFIAMILDALDGRIARLTHTQSAFGAEYDSLSDIVNFGLAPSLVIYNWGLSSLGKAGWLIAFFYTAATALRLARFNVATSQDKRFFQGLPSPAAAGILAGLVWVSNAYEISGPKWCLLAAVVTVMVAALMVSNILFHSFKELNFKNKVPFLSLLFLLLLFVFIALDPGLVLCMLFAIYGLSGPLQALWRWQRRLRVRRRKLL